VSKNLYIAIEGAIGVGKSTLARLIQPEFKAKLLMEVFEENPFLSKFYGDRQQYAFQTQIFFLLSRYRQQLATPALLESGNVVGDYTFAKDRLFAHLNVHGDELALYDHLHDLLAEKLVRPDLIAYLKADTDVLMERIAIRDRSYERNMDREYMEALNGAYERFFADYDLSPVLTIDTNRLNIVRNPEDLALVVERIRSVLQQGTHQRSLLEISAEGLTENSRAIFDGEHQSLPALQRWHRAFDQEKGFSTDIFMNFFCLQQEIGELAREMTHALRRRQMLERDGMSAGQALESALAEQQQGLRDELSDCLAYILKLANYAGVDLEDAYLHKMRQNCDRTWDTMWTSGDSPNQAAAGGGAP